MDKRVETIREALKLTLWMEDEAPYTALNSLVEDNDELHRIAEQATERGERLLAENAQLAEEIFANEDDMHHLEAENARLREALEEIAQEAGWTAALDAVDIARAALSPQEEA